MIPTLRLRYNGAFSDQRYAAFLDHLAGAFRWAGFPGRGVPALPRRRDRGRPAGRRPVGRGPAGDPGLPGARPVSRPPGPRGPAGDALPPFPVHRFRARLDRSRAGCAPA